MTIAFRVTYSTTTPESAEQGDYSESGFYSRGGWKHDDPSDWTLREVVSQFGRQVLEDGGTSFYSIDSDFDYRTGEDTSYAVHPPQTITASTYARVARILSSRPKYRGL